MACDKGIIMQELEKVYTVYVYKIRMQILSLSANLSKWWWQFFMLNTTQIIFLALEGEENIVQARLDFITWFSSWFRKTKKIF